MVEGLTEVAVGKNDLAATTKYGLTHKHGGRSSLRDQTLTHFSNMLCISPPNILSHAAIWPAIGIGLHYLMSPFGESPSSRAFAFVWTEIYQCLSITMIATFQDNNVAPACVRASQAHSQFVGFAPGIHKITDIKWFWKGRRQAFCVLNPVWVQVPCVRI
jgi:hypothetical protein